MTSQPAPFLFVPRQPGPGLRRYVRSIWYARGTVAYRRERIAPTGSTVAVVILGDPIHQLPEYGNGSGLTATTGFVTGPHDRPVINRPTGETHAVGVVTTPIGCEALFQIRPTDIRGRVVTLEQFWPAGSELRRQLLQQSDPDSALALLEKSLEASYTRDPTSLPVGIDHCEQAVALLESEPTRSIGDIADEIGISHNRLNRDFKRVVGLSPRALASLLRVRRLLGCIDVLDDNIWAELATEHGWYDQAHLIRDFRRYTGVSPTAYVEAQREFMTTVRPEDAAGFVPFR